MKFIRTFWGDVHSMGTRYTDQIEEAISDSLNELVYVWGKSNYDYLVERGFDCVLISEDSYHRELASNHTFWDHRSLNHKLWVVDTAVEEHDEIVFLDWDCRLIKPIDSKFYEYLRSGNELQVPLYLYPSTALDWLIDKTEDTDVSPFFHKLKKFMLKYSYRWNEHHIIPNTGFIYRRNSNLKLLDISLKHKLETVPDEFSVFIHAFNEMGYSMIDYIKNFEPNVIGGKEHHEDWWVNLQNKFDNFINDFIVKDLYFEHK